MNTNLNKIFALTAIVLSLLAFIAGNPFSSKKSFITPEQLADSLISRNQKINIIDLRQEKDFNEYHIPSAISSSKVTVANNYNKNDMIVFYSAKDNLSRISQYNFERSGFKQSYFLKGGIDSWINKVLFPALPQNENEASEKIERRSMYFGGTPEKQNSTSKKTYRREGC